MNSLISKTFSAVKKKNRPALLTYTVAGDNTKKKSLEILKSISDYADICELGFPHNTPIADGGQIQTSAYRACLLYTSPSPRDRSLSRMPSSA